MSGLAARVRLDGAPVEAADLRGFDAQAGSGECAPRYPVVTGNGFALSAPLIAHDRERRLWLALDGRLDNRTDWRRWLETRDAAPSDAELLLAGFVAWGDTAFARVVGPFALVLIAADERSVRLARDPLGERPLYFRTHGTALAVADAPAALLDLEPGRATADDDSIARFLAGRGPRRGATFFRQVEELPPGEALRCGAAGRSVVARTVPAPAAPPGSGSDRDYEERFRELLDLAVSCRLPAARRAAILMSGGLDSTSVAATAARQLKASAAPPPLAVSWVFRLLDAIDESHWIEAANRHSGASARFVVGDSLQPLSGEADGSGPVDSPILSPYWRLYERALEAAREDDRPVLLTGEAGDALWSGGREWLRSLVLSARFVPALVGSLHGIALGVAGRRQAHSLRSSVGSLLPRRGRRSPTEPIGWLTPLAQQAISESEDGLQEPIGTAEHRWSKLSSPLDRLFFEACDRQASEIGVELERPFRDRRLVEFFLGVPARLLYRPGEEKRLLRRALTDRLPPPILRRQKPTSLLPLFDQGLAGPGWPLLRATLEDRHALWPRFVRRGWLWEHAVAELGRAHDGVERIVLWQCFRLERWRLALGDRVAFPP